MVEGSDELNRDEVAHGLKLFRRRVEIGKDQQPLVLSVGTIFVDILRLLFEEKLDVVRVYRNKIVFRQRMLEFKKA